MSIKIILNKLTNAIALVATVVSLCMVLAVIVGYLFFALQHFRGPSPIYFCLLLLVTLYSEKLGLFAMVFLLPISPSLHTQLSFIYSPAVPFFISYAGIDICVGFMAGVVLLQLARCGNPLSSRDLIPWPVGVVFILIVISSVLVVYRNVVQQDLQLDTIDLIKKFFLFKIMSRDDPYFTVVDIFIYAICAALVFITKNRFRADENLESVVIFSLVSSLYLSAIFGIFQSTTKFGLPPETWNHRASSFYYGANGFQPDLHAFGALMLIGSVGLLGYLCYTRSRKKIIFLLGAVFLCWIALLLSKSRSSIMFSVLSTFLFMVCIFGRHISKASFIRFFVLSIALMAAITAIPLLLSSDLMQSFYRAKYTSFDFWNQMLSLRPELHRAALRIYSEYPWFGAGQTSFFQLSASPAHNYSEYAVHQGGENAHNYFLQVLSELGAIGAIGFIYLFAQPLISNSLSPRVISISFIILSIFWGNIYSHSLIVRENLFILTIAVSILYTKSNVKQL